MSENKVIIEIWICAKLVTIHSIILKGHINSGYEPHVLQCTLYNVGHVLISLQIVPRSISCQTSTRALVSSWTALGGFGSSRMRFSMSSQRCSMGFRSGKRAGQSVLCQCPRPLKIAGTLLPHEIEHCRVPGETQDRLHQRRAWQ